MINMVLTLALSPEEKLIWQGRKALVIPLSETECGELGANIIAQHEALQFIQKCLSTLQQVLESTGDKEGQIEKTLKMMIETIKAAEAVQSRVRELMGSARYIPENKAGGRIQ